MRGDVETIKERLDIAEIVSGYVKLEKAGQSFKGRCPFHNEKTPSFFVSPARQSFYCFGCGAKGDIFTFVEELEGLSFRETLKMLAEKAGVTLQYRPEAGKERSEKEKLLSVLEIATQFFENELSKNETARKYLLSRGLSEASIKSWRLGYAPAEWRALYTHMLQLGFSQEVLIKAGLAKPVVGTAGKEPYDVFRDRLIFPLSDSSGEIIAFSGRALSKETEPKYLNSPDTVLFTKSEVLYGLDKAKEKIRRKDYAVLVEGQMDLVLSHQAGVVNTVASSGTAFTATHLERLKRLSKRIILAFDGDAAGEKATEKSTELGLALGLEVKVAKLPEGQDPAELVKGDPQSWKEVLRFSLPAIEHFLNVIISAEKDPRKLGKLIVNKILPKIALLESSVERSHFVSLITKFTGLKEDVVWEDLKKVRLAKAPVTSFDKSSDRFARPDLSHDVASTSRPRREMIEERLTEVRMWLKENPDNSEFKREEVELENHLAQFNLGRELGELFVFLSQAEASKDEDRVLALTKQIAEVHKKIRTLDDVKKVL